MIASTPSIYTTTIDAVPNSDELYLMTLINEARADPARFGYPEYAPVPPLAFNALLAYSARTHSQSILNSDYQIGHCDIVGRCPTERAAAVGYAYGCTENLSATYNTGPSAMEGVNQSFLDSAGHRASIFSPDLNEFGVGHTYRIEEGDMWGDGQVTEVFCESHALVTPVLPTGARLREGSFEENRFTYIVNFYSADGYVPSKSEVHILGIAYPMTLSSGTASHEPIASRLG